LGEGDSPQPNPLEWRRRAFLAASASVVLPLIGCGASKDKDKATVATPYVNAGVVTTLAGSSLAGSDNGTGLAASFNFPQGIAVDTSGNVYVGDYNNHMVRKITPAGVVTTLAGSTTFGSVNATGTAASFKFPSGIAVDSIGNVYVADQLNNMIRKITADGVVTTFAGSTAAGSSNATGTAASFKGPSGIAVDSIGNVYVADTSNHMIRKITAGGVVTTLAGSTAAGFNDGTGTAAAFNTPLGVSVDSVGNVYVADTNNNKIRKITPGGVVTTFAGSTAPGNANGTGTSATFNGPTAIAVDSNGTLYVAEQTNNLIRKIA
jgi:serine/threonine protein kinase, bacterial